MVVHDACGRRQERDDIGADLSRAGDRLHAPSVRRRRSIDRPGPPQLTQTHYPQFCALARAAEIVGERWTLLIVRELLLGPKRFSDLVERLSGVSPTVLTGRLNPLIESGGVPRATRPPPSPPPPSALHPASLP